MITSKRIQPSAWSYTICPFLTSLTVGQPWLFQPYASWFVYLPQIPFQEFDASLMGWLPIIQPQTTFQICFKDLMNSASLDLLHLYIPASSGYLSLFFKFFLMTQGAPPVGHFILAPTYRGPTRSPGPTARTVLVWFRLWLCQQFLLSILS